ncbi:MAG: dienelactone hydrolase family protein [Gammaproteobacteria bacterium]
MALNTEWLDIDSGNGRFQAYLAAPAAASAPGVVVIQEIFGVNSHIRSVCERLAQAGYAALAPDIFWRVRPRIELGYGPDDIAQGRELKAKMKMDEVIEDVRASFAALAARPQCRGRKSAIVGYCYGGLVAYVAAARLHPACASSYYGGGIVEYLDEADKLDLPMQFHFGAKDAAIPLDQVEKIRAAVANKPAIEVLVYPDAGHGFHCDQRASFHAPSAELAWNRTLALFTRHLAA